MWTNMNIERENGALSHIFSREIFYVTIVLCWNIFYDWKQSMKLLLGKYELEYVNMVVCSIEYLTPYK